MGFEIVESSPTIGSDGTVYVGSHDKKLYAINGKSGVKLWEFETGQLVGSSPAIGSDGTVYVGSGDKKLYAINGKTGVKLWEFETGEVSMTRYPPPPSDLMAQFTSGQVGRTKSSMPSMARLGSSYGNLKRDRFVDSSPAIGSDGTVYVGSWDKKLYAINGKTGVKLWEFETGGIVESSPAIGSDGTVYVGSKDKKLYAIITESKGPAKSPWPMFGQNAQRTGRASKKE